MRCALLIALAAPGLRAERPPAAVSPERSFVEPLAAPSVSAAAAPSASVSAASTAPAAPAAPASLTRPASAQELFDRALQQREAGAQRQACELFEASVAAGPTPHGWLQVGRCREPVDAVAALEAYEAAHTLSERVADPMRRDAYLNAARERVEVLARRVPTITFRASPTGGVVAEVTLVGVSVASPVNRYDEPLRFNPGRYRVRAWAPGFWSYTLDLELLEGDRRVVSLPALLSAPVPAPALDPNGSAHFASEAGAPSTAAGGPLSRDDASGPVIDALPVALAGGGLALVVSGLVLGGFSSSERRQLERECAAPDPATGQRRCSSDLASTRDRMADFALAADVLWVSGALLAATGVGLFILDQQRDDTPRVSAGCGPAYCGLSARGRF